MAGVCFNAGEDAALVAFIKGQDLTLRLYTNNKTPAETDTEASYTECAAAHGYAAKTLTGANWTIVQGDPTTCTYAQQTWTFGTPPVDIGNVYGYYLTTAGGTALMAERFSDGPYNIANDGDEIRLTPVITCD